MLEQPQVSITQGTVVAAGAHFCLSTEGDHWFERIESRLPKGKMLAVRLARQRIESHLT